jgi:hypothetical protein
VIPACGAALLLGVLAVRYMIVDPLKMGRTMFLAAADGALLLAAVSLWFRGPSLAVVIPLCLARALVGWWIMSLRFMATPDRRQSPQLVRSPDHSGSGHTAVVYFTHGEPET